MKRIPIRRSIEARNRLVVQNLDLVERIAKFFVQQLPPCFDLQDLTQAGNLGLIDAASKWDPTRRVPFRMYAQLRIRGEILESVRRRRYRDATHAELEAVHFERADPAAVQAIDEPIGRAQIRRQVREALAGLSDKDREVIVLYYWRDKLERGVGDAFQVSESRGSQLLSDARVRLRRQLEMRGVHEALAA